MSANVTMKKTKEWQRIVQPYLSDHRNNTHAFSPERSALLVIDMQRYFLESDSHAFIPAATEIVGNVTSILEAYRRRDLPVIFTRHANSRGAPAVSMERWWRDVLYEDDQLSEISPALAPEPGEHVLQKSRYSAFVGTDLEGRLRSLGIERILITGVMTHLCCETTARDAFMRDFDVFIVIDGTASKSEDLHTASLRTLTDGFAIPVTTEEVLKWVK
ncbi:MAG: cysteine hydrolase [Candidatus Thermoplasmatota archaeon]|nr:cysteine hydrolase [Candidatus Thermoplasmatota archaeon]